ncbi:29938_t:CDS:2, partial [Racocetra persica]
GPGIELEEDIDIISESDDISKNTDNYQHGHLPPICIEIYSVIHDSISGTVNGLSKGPDNETIIKLTSMYPEHNHQLIPENASFATSYWKLTTDMKKLIKSYTICDIDISSQVRRTHDIQGYDTAKLFQHFEKEYTKNPDWYVQSLIDPETNRLQG